MSRTAKKTDPALWGRVKDEVTKGDKGGRPGQWSARKAQLASTTYRERGGGYEGAKAADNHLQQWTDEHWGTKSGRASAETGERYLPEKARESLSDDEYRRTSAKKRSDTRRGKQFSAQPADVARKTAAARDAEVPLDRLTRSALLERARIRGTKGRSRMRKSELIAALR